MSIQTLREDLKDLPGAERLVMRYEGDKQIYSIDDIAVEVGPTATSDDIRAAFLKARQPAPVMAKKPAKKAVKKTVKKRSK